MQTPMYMSFAPAPGGGVVIKVHRADLPDEHIVALPYGHDEALWVVAHILHKAGVARAEYQDGRLQEMAPS